MTETVFSHPSKLELLQSARRRGYRLVVFHLGLANIAYHTERRVFLDAQRA